MTNYIVSSGFAEKTTLSSGDTMSVFDSGVSLDVKVKSGAVESVYTGGLVSGGDITGTLAVSAGGSSYAASIGHRGFETVASGGVTYGTILDEAYETVSAGGAAFGTVIYDGYAVVETGGTESGTYVESGYDILQAGATATGTTVDGGIFEIYGQASDTILNYDAIVIIEQGVTNSGMVDSGGQQEVVSGGTADAAIILDGLQYVDGGTASHTVVQAYARQVVVSGGKAVDTVISGGSAYISAGGSASGSKITSGGYEYVNHGTIGRTTIDGGVLQLEPGSQETGPIVFSGAGGVLDITAYKAPTAVISNFTAGDQIDLPDIPYYTSAAATVEKAGIVTISSAAEIIKLKIAGATVGETDFVVTSAAHGLILTKSAAPAAPAQMQFLRPKTARITAFLTATAVADHDPAAVPEIHSITAIGMVRETASKPDYVTALILSATHG